ncbi:hypothetical protein SAMN02745146_0974 [Hymenobacter daecheongensis DSM 21074]|uniref:YbbR-like protein n=1 Tax=Hymenobacter daecheongensis DSM 21074 TaxID=1121955 RepID=A0A1M6BF03_9BACT|nr:hypothetical protein [Hymenobacter daecheongensis]SHI47033.1 hypothetical protein SAMN02745146_0974 [Hymenobacter daecheongensis DSM 21074]
MLTYTSRLLRWFISPFYGQERSYWRAITACFLAASTFWLLNALNKTYTTRITYPLQWRYDSERYIPVRPLPTEVAVNVTGRGWKLLRKNLLLDVRPAEVRLGRLPATRFVTGQSLRPALQAAMENLQFNYILNDTLWVEFDRLITRRVPLGLSPNADGSALPYAAVFTPESIAFRGPAATVNRLASPYPVHLPQAPAGSSEGAMSVPIGGPALVETNVQDVRVRLQPRPLVTLPVRVVPELHDFPDSLRFRLRPATVQVQVQCFPEDTARLDLSQVRVLLHYVQFRGSDSSLQPVLTQTPRLARGTRILTPTVRVSQR